MMKKKFDAIMDYIDINIQKSNEEIQRGILPYAGISSRAFANYFSLLTEDSLGHYISCRRLYYAAQALREEPGKSICDIAGEYGYAEQSSFSRAIKTEFNFTPLEIRNSIHLIPNKKYSAIHFDKAAMELRSNRFWRDMEMYGISSQANMFYMMSIQELSEQYGIDEETCYAIGDLAERLEISANALIAACAQLVIEEQNSPFHEMWDEYEAFRLGMKDPEDMQKICEFYDRKPYELDPIMVEWYYENQNAAEKA